MIAAVFFSGLDWLVLVVYFVSIICLGCVFWKRNRAADQFTSGGRSLPGWLCGLSIFATYLSSISYLALPGKAFVENWNAFVFSIALPPAAFLAVRGFVPLYRASGEVSAYSWLESRFGLWARLFASCFYLLFQIARGGVVMYLMALPMAVLFGWDIRTLIVLTGIVVTAYSLVGGILAVIWADAIQAIVLLAGALIALGILWAGLDGGPSEVWRVAAADGKFSFGGTSVWQVSEPTIWIVFSYGLFDNLRNFGVDQSYIQRYIAASSDREAAKSVWLGALLYVPVSALFLLIGTSLYVWYDRHPEELLEVRRIVAEQRMMQEGTLTSGAEQQAELEMIADSLEAGDLGDRVFPHFIASQLPVGIRGLLIAAIFAAAMSTVSTSLNSSATLVMSDFYQRLIRPRSNDQSLLRVLRLATFAWGTMGTMMALVLVQMTESVLDIWWTLSSVLGAGIVGLFLLGVLLPRVTSKDASAVLVMGMLLIGWMTISPSPLWPEAWQSFASPIHPYLVIVLGPSSMILLGRTILAFRPAH
ncbi:MAG: sodium:solute symporter [Aureliella sp.]